MPITYAGQPLLIGDPNHEFQAWLDRTLSLRDVRLFGELYPSHADNRDNPRGDQLAFVGLPTPNWHQHPPRLKINSLWWPTGASRWAVGLFLASGTTLAKIRENLDSSGGATLLLKEEYASNSKRTPLSVSPTMYLLTPRKINNRDDGDSRELLYLLPLVDKRYFWQYKDAGGLSVTCNTAWSAVLSSLAESLGESIEVSSIGNYAAPDPVEFTRRYENAAMLLDAAAWCVGHRIVVGWDGTLKSLSATASGTIYQGNVNGWSPGLAEGYGVGTFQEPDGYRVLAGGGEADYIAQFRPASVRVVFPRYQDYHDGLGFRVQPDGNVWAVTVTAGGLGYSDSVAGRVKTFFDTAYADFTDNPPAPNNTAALQALTNQIAGDFYGHGAYGVWDISCHGIRLWYPSGFDDWIWFHFGSQPEKDGDGDGLEGVNTPAAGLGDYECFTRIASLPYNCEIAELLHQFCPPDESSSSSAGSSSGGSSQGSEGSSGGGGGFDGYIDVVICDPWNRCGQYIVFPQKRMTFVDGLLTTIAALPNTVVPIYECQSSGGDSGSDTESDGEIDGLCVWCLEVSGDLVPAEAVGQYFPLFYKINGRCVWNKTGTDWYILRTVTPVPAWGIYRQGSNPQEYWYRANASVLGTYTAGPNVTGTATVAVCQESSSSSNPPPEPCGVFDEGTTPAAIDVALDTLTEGGCIEGCEASFGGTHRCVQVPESPCTYYYDFGEVCGVACELVVTFGAGVDIEVKLNMGEDYIRWVLASQSGDGLSYADLAINFHSNTPTAPCGGFGSNCAITSVP